METTAVNSCLHIIRRPSTTKLAVGVASGKDIAQMRTVTLTEPGAEVEDQTSYKQDEQRYRSVHANRDEVADKRHIRRRDGEGQTNRRPAGSPQQDICNSNQPREIIRRRQQTSPARPNRRATDDVPQPRTWTHDDRRRLPSPLRPIHIVHVTHVDNNNVFIRTLQRRRDYDRRHH